MFAIGEFSRLARVTIKALRHYDEAGLLKPARVDRESGYRYYSASQLPRLNRILVLKELGFTLDQIGLLLEKGISAPEMQGMLRLRRAEQESKLQEENSRLAAIENMIQEISREGTPLEVVIKESTPQWIVSVRDTVQSYQDIGRLYPEVYSQLGPKAMCGTPIAIWHESGPTSAGLEAEAGVLCDTPLDVEGRVQCTQLPVVQCASYVHHGSFQQFKGIYDRLMRWLEDAGWQPAGPCREIYLHIGNPVRQDDESYVTEIQLPVKKNA
jgi:DNA-binding transcriptional MerR regulator